MLYNCKLARKTIAAHIKLKIDNKLNTFFFKTMPIKPDKTKKIINK